MNDISTEHVAAVISKSQRKREAMQLLDLAKKLATMPESRLNGMPLDEELREAVDFARSIRAHGAKKRQLQTIGKMLRIRDASPLAEAVNSLDQKNTQMNVRHHRIETWRDLLIEGSDADLATLLEHCPDSNAQVLRQLIRNANKEAKLGKPPAAARKLFKLLRVTDERNPLPPLLQK